MNAAVSIEPTLKDVHRSAVDHANAWRGRCVNLLARGERWVSEALWAIEPDRKLPLLLSQKLDRLCKLKTDNSRVLDAIEAFRAFALLRNDLVHGDGAVFVDAKSGWLLRLETLDRAGRGQRVISEEEAESFHRQIKSAVDKLDHCLRTKQH